MTPTRRQFPNVAILTALLLLTLSAVVRAQDYTYWTNNGTITVTRYTGTNTVATIPDTITGLPVTTIGNGAFAELSNVTRVALPKNVVSIGAEAFFRCASLTNVSWVNVTNVGDSAFQMCFSLQSLPIETLRTFGHSAFADCYNLTSVSIGPVDTISDDAFNTCVSLANVNIPNTVTNIGSAAFMWCYKLTSVTLPDSVTTVKVFAFSACTSLTNVSIGNGVADIGAGAFDNCTNLTNVTLGKSVSNIGSWAFSRCSSLTRMTLPSSVTIIGSNNTGDGAFSACPSLTGLYFQGNAPNVGSNLFNLSPGVTVYYLPGTTGWGPTLGGRPTALWQPQVETGDASFGVQTNQFGFNIAWASGQVVVVEASENLANPIWSPLQTNTLTADTLFFSDPQWTNYPGRFYRLRSP